MCSEDGNLATMTDEDLERREKEALAAWAQEYDVYKTAALSYAYAVSKGGSASYKAQKRRRLMSTRKALDAADAVWAPLFAEERRRKAARDVAA